MLMQILEEKLLATTNSLASLTVERKNQEGLLQTLQANLAKTREEHLKKEEQMEAILTSHLAERCELKIMLEKEQGALLIVQQLNAVYLEQLQEAGRKAQTSEEERVLLSAELVALTRSHSELSTAYETNQEELIVTTNQLLEKTQSNVIIFLVFCIFEEERKSTTVCTFTPMYNIHIVFNPFLFSGETRDNGA